MYKLFWKCWLVLIIKHIRPVFKNYELNLVAWHLPTPTKKQKQFNFIKITDLKNDAPLIWKDKYF